MKKAIAAKRLLALCFCLVILLTTSLAWANSALLDRSLSLSSLADTLKTPEDVAQYMWKHFAFEDDRYLFGTSDYWQKPEQFVHSGKGDCEDFAIFAREILRRNGVPSFLLSVYGKKYAHTICVFEKNGKYQYINGTKLVTANTTDLKALLTEIYPNWSYGAIVTPSASGRGRILERINR